ncbi:MAG: hypothetical protein ABIJ97_01845, partial [Bacteroidota bacterium]
MDFDVGNFMNNLGGYDQSRKLSYMYDSGSDTTYYYGMVALTGSVSGHRVYSQFYGDFLESHSDSGYYKVMTTISELPTLPSDMRSVLTVGPYSISPNSSQKVAFALVAGNNLLDLQNGTDAALAVNLVPQGSIQVIKPNGGENWQVGTQKSITWTSSNVTNVKIEYTTNNGTSWLTVSPSSTASPGNFIWAIPNTPSTQCKVRVSDASNSSINDVSDNIFTISSPPTITVISPNGGEKWYVGTAQQVRWSSSGVSKVRIEYSTNSGSTWILIVSSVSASDGNYNWTIPNTPSTNCILKIVDVDDLSVFDFSDSVFTISPVPAITVISPNGGEKWYVGTAQQVRWSSSGVSTVRIEYSTNSGSTWILGVPSVSASDGNYNWTIPNTPSTNCILKI